MTIRTRSTNRYGHVRRRQPAEELRHVTFMPASAVEKNHKWPACALICPN